MTLLALTLAAHDAHARLACEVREHSEKARFLCDEVQRRLDRGLQHARVRDRVLEELDAAVADRMNNLLTTICTTSDLLRTQPNDEAAVRLREQLDTTVEADGTRSSGCATPFAACAESRSNTQSVSTRTMAA